MNTPEDLLFYEIMNYPVPINWEYFSTTKNNQTKQIKEEFSREEKNPLLEEYLEHIAKHQKIFKSLPWIKEIYLCNSLTFNSLHPGSDIDLFIVTKKGCIRRARFISAIVFVVLGLKRNHRKTDKRYCLSFYISEESQNLYPISIPNTDIYLAYRLAHLVPLYEEEKGKTTIYQNNPWVFGILPNLRKDQHIINIGINKFQGNEKIKTIIERYISGFIGYSVEYLIKTIRIPILIYKTKKLKGTGTNIIFNSTMLKFYNDKREKISLLYRTRKPR